MIKKNTIIKQSQLEMSIGKATHRLRSDIMFDFISKAEHKCFRCGGDLTRETFSIEHKIPWLHSDDPVINYFLI